MANKSFGTKQLDLTGASGSPIITSPSDLSINATTVAISTNISVGGYFGSNVNVGAGYSIGIGTTIPVAELEVKGDIGLSGSIVATGNTFTVKTSGSERLRINPDGRIGINDSTPNDYELDVVKRTSSDDAEMRLYNNDTGSSKDTIMRFQIAGTNSSNYIYFGDGDDSNAGQIVYSHASDALRFFTSGTLGVTTERLRIGKEGEIGIAGTNYGTSGQVLTSGGADASVSWGDGSNVPVGGIILWSGLIASIPTNWALCNGSNGTPDLRNTFIVGAHSDAVVGVNTATTTITGSNTKTGGSKDAVVVSHNHSYVTKGTTFTGDNHDEATGAWKLESTVNTGDSGESGTNKNLPPYYALAYIMKIS